MNAVYVYVQQFQSSKSQFVLAMQTILYITIHNYADMIGSNNLKKLYCKLKIHEIDIKKTVCQLTTVRMQLNNRNVHTQLCMTVNNKI